jgi:hypothetical protein
MVHFFLYIKAEIDNIGTIELRQNTNLRISVMNPFSGDEVQENVVFNPSETVEQEEGAQGRPHHFTL